METFNKLLKKVLSKVKCLLKKVSFNKIFFKSIVYKMRKNLIYESIFIGVMTLLLTNIIYYIFNNKYPETTKPGYYQMIIGAFLVGFVLHMGFEFTGMNESWCRNTYKLI